jgi:hypothetical protein
MKTALVYGAGLAVANTVVMLLLFFLGFHTAERFLSGMLLQFGLGVLVLAVVLVLGMRARRNESGPEGFPYSRALGTGVLIALFAGLISIVLTPLYTRVINPGYHDAALEWTVGMMEKAGAPSDKIDEAREQHLNGRSVVRESVVGVIGSVILGTIFSLVIAAFVRKPPQEPAPVSGSSA